MKVIHLTRGKISLIDNEDYEKVNQYKWYASPAPGDTFYAKRKIWIPNNGHLTKQGKYIKNGQYKSISLHRFIINAPYNKEVDHIDGDGLNNRRNNLRLCNHMENMRNVPVRKTSKSGLKGVTWCKQTNKWRVVIQDNKKYIHVGRFIEIEDAIKAYNNKAKELFGEFAYQNKL